jgi:hypothetical protein
MSEISKEELGEIYAFAVQLGKDAGKMLLNAAKLRMGDADGKGREEMKEHVQKMNAADLVTETDEGMLLAQLLWFLSFRFRRQLYLLLLLASVLLLRLCRC